MVRIICAICSHNSNTAQPRNSVVLDDHFRFIHRRNKVICIGFIIIVVKSNDADAQIIVSKSIDRCLK